MSTLEPDRYSQNFIPRLTEPSDSQENSRAQAATTIEMIDHVPDLDTVENDMKAVMKSVLQNPIKSKKERLIEVNF